MVKTFVDIKEMPDYNPVVRDNISSIRDKQVFIKDGYPNCIRHGAMNKVSRWHMEMSYVWCGLL